MVEPGKREDANGGGIIKDKIHLTVKQVPALPEKLIFKGIL